MRPVTIGKSDMGRFIAGLSRHYEVFGPKRKPLANDFCFDRIESPDEIALDYDNTILPPKKLLLPTCETLIRFEKGRPVPEYPAFVRKQVVFGIRPCDLSAFLYLDKVYTSHRTDPRYRMRRENLLTVAISCPKPCQGCFCAAMGSGPDPKAGFDLLLTDFGKRYLAEPGSERGAGLLELARTRPATPRELARKKKLFSRLRRRGRRELDARDLPGLIDGGLDHKVWAEIGEKCLDCGQCAMVCPTCFCFDIRDKMEPSLDRGERYRTWDVCLLAEFSGVAMGGNFRRERKDRLRQFQAHNLGYSQEQFGSPKCVGCGRCIRVCPVHIDIRETVKQLRRGSA
jgi:sulfhydrogenase subunit beta (sulfur reductase)